MARNYMLRQDMAMVARMDSPCSCGHQRGGHKEYQPTRTASVVNGVIVITETPHPRYRTALFHCEVDGCGCEIQR